MTWEYVLIILYSEAIFLLAVMFIGSWSSTRSLSYGSWI